MAGGIIIFVRRRKQRKPDAASDLRAKEQLENQGPAETIVAPLLLATGVCLLIASTYADNARLRTPLPEKALEEVDEERTNTQLRLPPTTIRPLRPSPVSGPAW
jgi:hypothetical protein